MDFHEYTTRINKEVQCIQRMIQIINFIAVRKGSSLGKYDILILF